MTNLRRLSCVLLALMMVFAMVVSTTFTASAATPLKHLVQWESQWKYYIGGGTLYNTGCGIFSLRNAVGYLTGKDMGIDGPARWAHSINAYNVNGGDGTYRLVLYPKVQAKYGAKYGFTLNCNGGQGWWAGSSSSVLKKHLANGGVAVGHVPGHFIAIVDYDYNTNKFHVLDSAPSSGRGTSSNYGDCWVTQSRLATGQLKLDWFCLLSATGTPADEQAQESAEKTALLKTINTARTKYYYNFSSSTIMPFRQAYEDAVGVYSKEGATDAQYKAARTTLENAMNASSYSVLSKGKSYTVKNTTNTGDYADDGKKLTDGSKGNLDGGTSKFVGFNNGEIVVDLGSAQTANIFKIYMTAGDWGIEIPSAEQLSMSVSVSTDGTNYTAVATNNTYSRSGVKTGAWEALTVTANASTAVSARYVKFKVNSTAPNNYVWLDEVEVASGEPLLSDKVYINEINKKVGAGDSVLFTSAFGTISVDSANHSWTVNVVAKWDAAKNGYVVKSKTVGNGASTPSITLASDEILIAAHNWESGVTDSSIVVGSGVNASKLNSVNVGDVITLDGVFVDVKYVTVAAYANINGTGSSSGDHTHSPGEVTCTGGQSCLTCGELLAQPLGHDDGNWVTVENYEQRVCTKCGEVLEVKGDLIKDTETIENNIATSKQYSTSLPYAQGDASNDWGYVEGKEPDYPDENGSTLTDGIVPNSGDFHNTAWVGLHPGSPDASEKGYSWITVDLGDTYDISKIVLYGANDTLGEGVSTLQDVRFYNGETGEELGVAIVTEYNDVTNAYTLSGDFTAKVIETRITHWGWNFVSELAVEGVVHSDDNDNSSVPEESIPEESVPEESVPEESEPVESVPDDESSVPEESIPEESVPEESIPEESEPEDNTDKEPEPVEKLRGDINGNDKIDMTDYILLKRFYFNTYTLNEEQTAASDIDANGTISMTDYILLKRAYFGTYTIVKPTFIY